MLRSLFRILHASLVQIDTEMVKKYAKQQQPAVCGKFTFGRYAAGSVSALMGLVTSTFDLLTLKLVRESHLSLETFNTNLGTLGLLGSRVIRYVCDGRTDGLTDKSNAYCPFLGAGAAACVKRLSSFMMANTIVAVLVQFTSCVQPSSVLLSQFLLLDGRSMGKKYKYFFINQQLL